MGGSSRSHSEMSLNYQNLIPDQIHNLPSSYGIFNPFFFQIFTKISELFSESGLSFESITKC